MPRTVITALATLSLLGAVLAPASAGAAPSDGPTVTGPVTGGKGGPTIIATGFDLAAAGYVEEEYFVEGTATAYAPKGALKADGKWAVTPAGTAPYKTRIVVYRPEKEADFNGTVVVEWLNVSAGFDTSPTWAQAHNAIIRSGAAWVGVSAQAVGVQGGSAAVGGLTAGGLRAADPERYATLRHPGDIYSYDLYSQVGRALRKGGKTGLLGGFPVERMIAVGESSAAIYLTTYVNAIQPRDNVFDGFLLFSRFAGAANLITPPAAPAGQRPVSLMPNPSRIRTDTKVPVLMFQTEWDVASGRYVTARQPDTKMIRLWEVPGTSHADSYTPPGAGYQDLGDGQAERDLLDPTKLNGGALNCQPAINAGGAYLVLNAAVAGLERWVRDGTPPARAPRLDVTSGDPPVVQRDEHGNALGGIRTPLVEAPLSTISSEGAGGGTFCNTFGTTTPFDAATIAALYQSHEAWVAKFDKAADRLRQAGFLTAPDAKNLKAAAAQSTVVGG
jgi:hypothetical protein